MNHQSLIVEEKQNPVWNCAILVGSGTSVTASANYPLILQFQTMQNVLVNEEDWCDLESRQAYMEACVEQDIAWQISINRKARDLSQKQLAEKIKTTQTSIARWEDPCYGRHSIPSLIKIAHAFDCALMVRLIPYSKLAEISKDTRDSTYLAVSYESEIQEMLNYDR